MTENDSEDNNWPKIDNSHRLKMIIDIYFSGKMVLHIELETRLSKFSAI